MVLRRNKDNNFPVDRDLFKDKEKRTWFIFWPYDKSIDSHLFGQGDFLMDITILFETYFGKLIDRLVYCCTKH